MGGIDIALLMSFRSAAQQYDQDIALAAKIDAIAWPKIEAALDYAFADGFAVAEIALLHAIDASGDTGTSASFQLIEPFRKRLLAVIRYEIADF